MFAAIAITLASGFLPPGSAWKTPSEWNGSHLPVGV